ncbi:MAG: NnrU family protein [Erythrobacter sp.]
MDHALTELLAASLTLIGTHFAMSHPLRAPMEGVLGQKGFQAVYSLVSLAAIVWIYFAFKAAPTADLPGSGDTGWIIASLLLIPGLVLYAGAFSGNPALPTPSAEKQARAEPRGVFLVTRHPMMWSFALWALSHIVLLWSWRTMIVAVTIGALSLIGAHLQDRKKRALMGDAWDQWQSRTSYWPRWHKMFSAGALPWAIGIALWVFISWLHLPIGDIPAGIWRWF